MQNADIQYKPTGFSNNNYSIVNNTILFTTDKPDSFKNSVVKFSAKLNSETVSDNEISVRWSSAPHYGDNIVQCFDLGFGIKTGKTRFRYELKHPEYTNVIAEGDTVGHPLSTNEYVGLEFVKVNNLDKTTGLEIYQLVKDERIRLFSHTAKEYFVDSYPNGCQIAIKPKENFQKISIKDIIVAEIELI